MTRKYSALVMKIDDIVKEAVLLCVNGVMVQCFISYSPSKVEVGRVYEVEFEMVLPDSIQVELSQYGNVGVETIDESFSCVIAGYLDGSVFKSFVDLDDQDIHYDYPQLNKKYIRLHVLRIDVEF